MVMDNLDYRAGDVVWMASKPAVESGDQAVLHVLLSTTEDDLTSFRVELFVACRLLSRALDVDVPIRPNSWRRRGDVNDPGNGGEGNIHEALPCHERRSRHLFRHNIPMAWKQVDDRTPTI